MRPDQRPGPGIGFEHTVLMRVTIRKRSGRIHDEVRLRVVGGQYCHNLYLGIFRRFS